MRFTTAWADVSVQNVTLRGAIVCLSLVSIALVAVCMKLSLRAPLIIDRGCVSKTIAAGDTRRTNEEILSFIEEALRARFDSSAVTGTSYLSQEEGEFRKQEQENFKSNNVSQKIVLSSVSQAQLSNNPESGATFSVDADRILSVGKVRSVLAFPLTVTIASISRSTANPYGLVLTKVAAANKDKEPEAGK